MTPLPPQVAVPQAGLGQGDPLRPRRVGFFDDVERLVPSTAGRYGPEDRRGAAQKERGFRAAAG